MELFTLYRLMGHCYVGLTARYLRTTPGLWKKDYQRCHPFALE